MAQPSLLHVKPGGADGMIGGGGEGNGGKGEGVGDGEEKEGGEGRFNGEGGGDGDDCATTNEPPPCPPLCDSQSDLH